MKSLILGLTSFVAVWILWFVWPQSRIGVAAVTMFIFLWGVFTILLSLLKNGWYDVFDVGLAFFVSLITTFFLVAGYREEKFTFIHTSVFWIPLLLSIVAGFTIFISEVED